MNSNIEESEFMSELDGQTIPSQMLLTLNPQKRQFNNSIASITTRFLNESSNQRRHIARSCLTYNLLKDIEDIGILKQQSNDQKDFTSFVITYNSFLILNNVRLLQASSDLYQQITSDKQKKMFLLQKLRNFNALSIADNYYKQNEKEIFQAQRLEYSSERQLYILFCKVINKVYIDLYNFLHKQGDKKNSQAIYGALARIVYIRSIPKMKLTDNNQFTQFNQWRKGKGLFEVMELDIEELDEYFKKAPPQLLCEDIAYKVQHIISRKNKQS